jgi:hypothetical protein
VALDADLRFRFVLQQLDWAQRKHFWKAKLSAVGARDEMAVKTVLAHLRKLNTHVAANALGPSVRATEGAVLVVLLTRNLCFAPPVLANYGVPSRLDMRANAITEKCKGVLWKFPRCLLNPATHVREQPVAIDVLFSGEGKGKFKIGDRECL